MAEQASEHARTLMGYVGEMAAVLSRLRAYPEKLSEADEEGLYRDVRALTEGVCERWSAVCVKPSAVLSPIRYGGREYASHADLLFWHAYETYQALYQAVCGYPDDALGGHLDAQTALERWPRVAEQLRTPGLLPDSGELARLAEVASRELASVPGRSWPEQTIYQAPGAPEDRWSAEAAARQLARLADYREGGPVRRQPEPHKPFVSDVMLVIEGDSHDRFVTKLGGLPYRPASAAWPRLQSGEPMAFFGQVCFADSRDLFDELPGDVLLIFTSDEHGHTTEGLHYEWYPLGIEGLVSEADIPDTPWRAAPYHMRLSRREEAEDAERWPEWMEEPKIGGRAYWIQREPRECGRFLAAFGSLYRYPEPVTPDPRVRKLDFFDAGLLNLCLMPDGRVREDFQCY